jgi:AcrR family transcriptional regulator
MARVTAERAQETRHGILAAAREVLQTEGYARLSTRNVAATAGVPLSQIQYHFGSKDGMILALFQYLNDQLLERQQKMFADPELTFSEKWRIACDYLDDDFDSGFVRVTHELTAAGWSNPEIGKALRTAVRGWIELLRQQAHLWLTRHASRTPIDAHETAALVAAVFIGAESAILLGLEEEGVPFRAALRKLGDLLESADHS